MAFFIKKKNNCKSTRNDTIHDLYPFEYKHYLVKPSMYNMMNILKAPVSASVCIRSDSRHVNKFAKKNHLT